MKLTKSVNYCLKIALDPNTEKQNKLAIISRSNGPVKQLWGLREGLTFILLGKKIYFGDFC